APAGRIYLDARPELVEAAVVRDRRQLAEEGVVVVFVPSDTRSGELTVVSRGAAPAGEVIAVEVRRAARAGLALAPPAERADAGRVRGPPVGAGRDRPGRQARLPPGRRPAPGHRPGDRLKSDRFVGP